MIKVTLPFTELNEIGFDSSSCVNVACSWPLMVESLASPSRPRAVTGPLIDDALTLPSTPSMSSEPLISSIDSSMRLRGTVNVYSTIAGLS